MPRKPKPKAKDQLPGSMTAALTKALGAPVLAEPDIPENALGRITALTQMIRQRANPPKNPYATSFYKFLSELVYTRDEAGGGDIQKAPDWPYLKDLCDDLITEPRLFLEKSRRVFASWCVCAFDVWLAAGGQDPRWKDSEGRSTLMRSSTGRQVYIASRKFEQSDFFLQRRVKCVVDEFERRGFREKWPEFPEWHFKQGEASCSNDSLITAVAQGPDVSRGPGATLFHLEELATWEHAAETMQGLLPTLAGGGHVVAISTPKANTYAADLVAGRLRKGMDKPV